jgi:hypothetical protein
VRQYTNVADLPLAPPVPALSRIGWLQPMAAKQGT